MNLHHPTSSEGPWESHAACLINISRAGEEKAECCMHLDSCMKGREKVTAKTVSRPQHPAPGLEGN